MSNSVLSLYIDRINEYLEKALSDGDDIVTTAMRYSLSNGGKRVRPALSLEFCRICGGDTEKALPFAAAVEMIHTYSLIHDDLPCMDDDDMRRGKPSCHIKYGEEYALLAGDGLLTKAFEIMASAELETEKTVKAVSVLSKCAGHRGMVEGQTLDLQSEGKSIELSQIRHIHELKTVEMIKAACLLGCIAAGASKEQLTAAEKYAYGIGLSFQIVDDILDVTADEQVLGKPTGSDAEREKDTYVTLLGLEKAKEEAKKYTDEAIDALSIFGDKGNGLKELAEGLLTRKN